MQPPRASVEQAVQKPRVQPTCGQMLLVPDDHKYLFLPFLFVPSLIPIEISLNLLAGLNQKQRLLLPL